MPITSIWPIKGSYAQALSYIANPMKTEAKDGIVAELEDVLDYVSNGEKTNQKYYVTGINCDPDSATESFRKTKIAFDKPDGVLAFHAIQSFKPGEVNAALTHQIGTELAARMGEISLKWLSARIWIKNIRIIISSLILFPG